MSESSRRGQAWAEDELTLLLDMHFNGHLIDSHDHDDISRFLGRHNPGARSFQDGAVNQKLAEIKGEVEASRAGRHPGNMLIELIDKYESNHAALRVAAIAACRSICRWAEGPVPEYVARLLRSEP